MVVENQDIDLTFAAKISMLGGKGIKRCFQCAVCTGSCPSARASDFRIRRLVRQLQLGLREKILRNADLWKCTICYKCDERCPEDVSIPNIILTCRNLAVKEGTAPEAVTNLEKTVANFKNIFGMNNSSRKSWINKADTVVEVKSEAETVYYVGCITSYSKRIQGVANAISSILNYVGENWTILAEEWCCGQPLVLSGATEKLKEYAEHNVNAVEAVGARRLVAGCPGCVSIFKNLYPKLLGRELKFEVIHFTELLNKYILEGKLLTQKFSKKIAYHDPCELRRLLGVFKEPRNALNAFAAQFVETGDSNCCGAGGFVLGTNLQIANALAYAKLKMLIDSGVEVCVTACPLCKSHFLGAAVKQKIQLPVLDIAELVVENLVTKGGQ